MATAEEVMKWQPIETAPKDKNPILVGWFWDDTKEWEVRRAIWSEDEQKFVDATYDPFRDSCERSQFWMPLPKHPENT